MNEKIRWRILVKQDKMFSFNVLLPEDSSTNSQSWTYEDAMWCLRLHKFRESASDKTTDRISYRGGSVHLPTFHSSDNVHCRRLFHVSTTSFLSILPHKL